MTKHIHVHMKKRIPVNIKGNNGVILALEEKGFGVYQTASGKIFCQQSREISELAKKAKTSILSWIDYLVDDMAVDLPKVATAFGFSETLVKSLIKEPRSGYEDIGSEMGILLPAITVSGFDVKLNPLVILINKNTILTLHTTEVKRFFRVRRYAETLFRKIPKNMLPADRRTLLLIRILDENNSRNFNHLLEIEEHGDRLSAQLADTASSRKTLGSQIYLMKHALVTYLAGLWATVDALNSIRYGDADLLTDDPHLLNRITGLISEVHSHIGLAEHLSEVLASGLEVLQSLYNNQLQILNNKLSMVVAYLTIIGTAVLVPNTLGTVLGPPFSWTEQDIGWYSALMIGSTVISTIISWVAIDKLGFLPKSPEGD
ncbi:MAG: CorA family divalent cation transporter [Candidatus Micrarchaeota archaeon]|nr:CorA family divalent cation transporter [Candidatus Micrarchaeota archaeon]